MTWCVVSRFGIDKDEYETKAHEAYEQYQKHFEKYNNALKEQEEVPIATVPLVLCH